MKNDNLWLLKNFVRLNKYVEETVKMMMTICVKKDNLQLDKYENIGFLFDIMDYQISVGDKILSSADEQLIKDFFPGGKKDVLNILEKLKDRKMNDFLKFDNLDENFDYGDLSSEELQDRILKLAKKG